MIINRKVKNMRRKRLRLKGYDYSKKGIYFVTICSCGKKKIFCDIDDEIKKILYYDISFDKYIKYTLIGNIIKDSILNIEKFYKNVKVLKYIIMPNHIHLLIEFIDFPQSINGITTLSKIIKSFKMSVTKKYNVICKKRQQIWQKSFYEHIIRNEKALNKIIEYIIYNPIKWKLYKYNKM